MPTNRNIPIHIWWKWYLEWAKIIPLWTFLWLFYCIARRKKQRTNELNKYCCVRSLFFQMDTFQFAHNSRLKSFNWNIGSFEVKKATFKQSKMSIIWNFTKKIVLFCAFVDFLFDIFLSESHIFAFNYHAEKRNWNSLNLLWTTSFWLFDGIQLTSSGGAFLPTPNRTLSAK